MNEKISIVVPVYNTPKEKLERCFLSIIRQTYENFECIIVDDGSKKECGAFLDELPLRDRRMKVIHKENAGSAVARNVGVKSASGEYCTFVDSDDLIFPWVLQEAAGLIERYTVADVKPDMVAGLVHRFSAKNEDKFSDYNSNSKIMGIINFDSVDKKNEFFNHIMGYTAQEILSENGYIGDAPYAKVFKTKIGKDNLFTDEKYFDDDTIWNIKILAECNNIILIQNTWYAYMLYSESKTFSYRPNCPDEFLYRITQEKSLTNELWPVECNKGIAKRIWNCTLILARAYLFHPRNNNTNRKNYEIFKNIIHSDTYVWALKNLDFSDYTNPMKRALKTVMRYFSLRSPNWIAYKFWGLLAKREFKKAQ